MRLLFFILRNIALWLIAILLFFLVIGTVDYFFGMQSVGPLKLISSLVLCSALFYSLKFMDT